MGIFSTIFSAVAPDTALVAQAGPYVGSMLGATGPLQTMAQIAQQFQGRPPPNVDIHIGIGANPDKVPPIRSVESWAVFQASADGTTLNYLGSGTSAWGSTPVLPNVPLDPTAGAVVIYTDVSKDPISFGLTLPGAPAPAPGTPGGAVPADPNAPPPVDPSKTIDHVLIAVAIVIIVVVTILILSAKAEKAGLRLMPWLAKKFGG